MVRQEELCAEVNERAPSFLESGQWTDCEFVVGTEPHQVVVGGYKLVMAMASPVFEAMFYGALAETRDHIPIVDIEPEIFKTMLRYIHKNNVELKSLDEAIKLYYTANKYMLNHLKKECSDYLQNNVNTGNVCQLYETAQLFEDDLLKQKCIKIFTENTKELLQDNGFKNAALNTVEKIFSMDELNISSEVDLINAAALYVRAQDDIAVENKPSSPGISTAPLDNISVMNVETNVKTLTETQNSTDGHEQATPGSSLINDTVNKHGIRSVVKHIRFLTLTPQQYADCEARSSLLTTLEDHAVILNMIASKKPSVPMPSGFSTSRVHREKIDKARSEATFRYTVQNFSSLESVEMSPVCYVRNLPWQIKTMPRFTSSQEKYLGFFVQCSTESDSSNWSCSASAELRLICHKPVAEPFCKNFKHLYTKKESDRGFAHFISWDTVLDPTHGYIKDDAITLEVHLTADEPYGVI